MATCALVIADSGAPSSGDTTLQGRIEGLGHTVTLVSDEASAELTKDFVVLAESCSSANIGTKYRDFSGGLILCEQGALANMEYASAVGAANPATSIDVQDPAHALAAGLSGNNVTVFTSSSTSHSVNPANLPAAADLVADDNGTTTRQSLFAFEAGEAMDGGFTAPDRRVFFGYAQDAAIANWNSNTQALFDAAVMWVAPAGGDALPVVLLGGL